MQLSKEDQRKIQLIVTSTQVNDLILLLLSINKEDLEHAAINVKTGMAPFLGATLEFYGIVQEILSQEEAKEASQDKEQLPLDLNE